MVTSLFLAHTLMDYIPVIMNFMIASVIVVLLNAKNLSTLITDLRLTYLWAVERNDVLQINKVNDAILPVMSKIMEKAVNVQLQRYLQRFDLLSPFQAGFRQHHSTESAVLYFTDEIRRSAESGKVNRRFVYWSEEGLWFCTAQGTLIEIEKIWLCRKFD